MRHLNLPSGGWADVREPDELTTKGRRAIQRALLHISPETRTALQEIKRLRDNGTAEEDLPKVQDVFSQQDAEASWEANDACVLALVAKWSFEHSITADGLQELPVADYDKLTAFCAPAIQAGQVDFSPTKEVLADPEGHVNHPFGNLSESNKPSPDSSGSPVPYPMPSETTVSSV
jgi:hypothetical protein